MTIGLRDQIFPRNCARKCSLEGIVAVSNQSFILRSKSLCDYSVLQAFMAVLDENWQKIKASITERGNFMFNNDLLSDISLVVRSSSVEDETKKSKMAIPAHKFVLSSCSPVFFAMFCGEMAERSGSVDLPDCEYEGVLEMLRYMYGGKAELNENNVMQVLYVAKKYILPSLADECVRFLEEKVNTGNVFCVLSHAQQYDEKDLVDQCWEVIDRETEEVLKSEAFATIERSLLEAVVKRDTLTIREVELFKAVNLWATKECERQGQSANGNAKRFMIGEGIVKKIRFPVMLEREFVSVVLASEILKSDEVFGIMKYFNKVVSSAAAGFLEERRIGTLLSCCRFAQLSERPDVWSYNEMEKEHLDVKVDKDIILYGVRMFGSENGEYLAILKMVPKDSSQSDVDIHVSGKYSSERMHNTQSSSTPSTNYYAFDILFDSPVVLNKDIEYCVVAIITGPDSIYGVDCSESVQSHGVTFSFPFSEDGQFAEFLFRLK